MRCLDGVLWTSRRGSGGPVVQRFFLLRATANDTTSRSPSACRDAVARSATLRQGLETGTTRIAGHLPDPEGRGEHRPLPRTGQESLVVVVAGGS